MQHSRERMLELYDQFLKGAMSRTGQSSAEHRFHPLRDDSHVEQVQRIRNNRWLPRAARGDERSEDMEVSRLEA